MPTITLDARTWLRGASISDEVANAGFSPSQKGVSILPTPGLLIPTEGFSAGTGYQSNGLIAANAQITALVSGAAGFAQALSSNAALDGYLYDLDPAAATTTLRTGWPDTARNYTAKISDVIKYGANIYVTSETDIARDTGGGITGNYWTATLGGAALNANYRHMMVAYGDNIYITNGDSLAMFNGAAATNVALDFPTNYFITAIAVYKNLIWIAASPGGNIVGVNDNSVYGGTKIVTWDGFSSSWLDEYTVPDMVTSFAPFGGLLYCNTKFYFGYFNGDVIVPIYPLSTTVEKYQVATMPDRLYLAQTDSLLCYASPVYGNRVISFPHQHTANIQGIFACRNRALYSSAGTSALFVSNGDAAGLPGGPTARSWLSNRIPLGGYGKIRRVTIESEVLASGASITIAYINSKGQTKTVGTYSYASYGAVLEHLFDVLDNVPTYTVQLKLTWDSTPGTGVRRITIEYERSELRPN